MQTISFSLKKSGLKKRRQDLTARTKDFISKEMSHYNRISIFILKI